MREPASIVRVLPAAEDVATAAAALFTELCAESIRETGRFGVALSGGSTPKLFFAELASDRWAPRIDWSSVHLFWGDDRCVPPGHPDSNFGLARRELIDLVSIPPAQIHRIRGEDDPEQAALAYEAVLRDFVERRRGGPRGLDLVFLGLGTDGHTASLFPGSEAVRRTLAGERERWVVTSYAPKLDAWRVTLTPSAINLSGTVAFLVTGERKAARLSEVMRPASALSLPAQLIRPIDGRLVWLVDRSAARELSDQGAAAPAQSGPTDG